MSDTFDIASYQSQCTEPRGKMFTFTSILRNFHLKNYGSDVNLKRLGSETVVVFDKDRDTSEGF